MQGCIDALGKLVYEDLLNNFESKYSKQLTVEGLSQGICVIQLTGSETEVAKKIIIY